MSLQERKYIWVVNEEMNSIKSILACSLSSLTLLTANSFHRVISESCLRLNNTVPLEGG